MILTHLSLASISPVWSILFCLLCFNVKSHRAQLGLELLILYLLSAGIISVGYQAQLSVRVQSLILLTDCEPNTSLGTGVSHMNQMYFLPSRSSRTSQHALGI